MTAAHVLSKTNRSALSNGKLPVKSNSKAGRRFRDLLADFLSRAQQPMDESRIVALRTAVVCQIQIEKIEAEFLAGKRQSLGSNFIRLSRLYKSSLDFGLHGRRAVDEADPDDPRALGEYLRKNYSPGNKMATFNEDEADDELERSSIPRLKLKDEEEKHHA